VTFDQQAIPSDPSSYHRKHIYFATMRFSGGTLSLLLTATAVAASVFQSTPVTSRNSLQTRSVFGVAKTSNLGFLNTLAVPRGGAAAAAADDESDDADAEVVPEVLYLPGLLSASVSKKSVRSFVGYML